MAHEFAKELSIRSVTGKATELVLQKGIVVLKEQDAGSLIEKTYSVFEFHQLIKNDTLLNREYGALFGSSAWFDFKETVFKHTFRTKTGRLPDFVVDVINNKVGFTITAFVSILFVANVFFSSTMAIGTLRHSIIDLRYLILYLLFFPLVFLFLSYFIVRPKFQRMSTKRLVSSVIAGTSIFFSLVTFLHYSSAARTPVQAEVINYSVRTESKSGTRLSAQDKYLVLETVIAGGEKLDITIHSNKTRSEQTNELQDLAEKNKQLIVILNTALPGIKIYQGYRTLKPV